MATHTVHTGAAFQNITRNYFFFFFLVRFEVNFLLLGSSGSPDPDAPEGAAAGTHPSELVSGGENPIRH